MTHQENKKVASASRRLCFGNHQRLSHNSHHIQHPPSNTLLASMREVSQRPALIPCTSGTLSHHRNPFLTNAGIHQLPSIRLPEIQPDRTCPAEQRLRISKLPCKLRPHFLANGVAASPDTRPNRRDHILNPRPILRTHHRNSPLHNPRHRPSPPCMKRRHHSLLHIDHQHRNAIRRPHPQQHPRHIRHQPIPLQHRLPLRRLQPPFERSILLPHHSCNSRVNLPHSHQRITSIFTTNGTQKPPSILRHQRRIILLRPPQIQRIPPINRRNPTHPGTKPMP